MKEGFGKYMDDNRKTVKISSSRTTRPSSAGRSSAAGSPQRRSSARPASVRPASVNTRSSSGSTKKPAAGGAPKKNKGFRVQTALIIAVAAVVIICVPLILFTVSATNSESAAPQENDPILIAPATAVPGESTTVEEDPTEVQDPEAQTPDAKTYQRDDEDPEIARIQQRLMDLGYMAKSEPTELFGPATEESVKLFQTMNDITSNGICDAETQNALFSEQAETFVLAEGSENIAVSQLQSRLRDLGYLNANSTAYYGTVTVNAVKNFQTQNGLDADGKVGITTWNKVFSSSAAKAPAPNATKEPYIT